MNMRAKADSGAKPRKRTKVVEDMIRDWRKVWGQLIELKPTLVAGKKLEDEERALRAEVGTTLDVERASLDVDGKVAIYERSLRSGPLDYEGAWTALLNGASVDLRQKMAALLCYKPSVVLHKLTSE